MAWTSGADRSGGLISWNGPRTPDNARITADLAGGPALTVRCQDGAELAFWLACGCSLVLTMQVATNKAIGSAV